MSALCIVGIRIAGIGFTCVVSFTGMLDHVGSRGRIPVCKSKCRAGAQRSQGWFGYFLGSPWLIWLVCFGTPVAIIDAELGLSGPRGGMVAMNGDMACWGG